MTAPLDGMTKEQLEQLVHELVARRLVAALRDPAMGFHPQILAQALRFLKDNEVTGLDMPGTATEAVREAFKDKLPFKIAK